MKLIGSNRLHLDIYKLTFGLSQAETSSYDLFTTSSDLTRPHIKVKALKALSKAGHKIKLSKCSFLKKNPLFRSPSKCKIHPPTYRQNYSTHEIETPNQYQRI